MKNLTHQQRGFTLIELMVVIAIIALLSAIVLSVTTTARLKSKDAAVRTLVFQYRSLLELNYNELGTYVSIQGTAGTANNCTSGFTGTYANQAQNICNSIINTVGTANTNKVYTGVTAGAGGSTIHYSVMGYLPYKGTYFCMGDSGRYSDTDTGTGAQAGCYGNP